MLILSNFSYCPLFWFISSTKLLNKQENLQKLLHNDYISSDHLLEKSVKTTIHVRNYRTLCVEISKTINNLNQFRKPTRSNLEQRGYERLVLKYGTLYRTP